MNELVQNSMWSFGVAPSSVLVSGFEGVQSLVSHLQYGATGPESTIMAVM